MLSTSYLVIPALVGLFLIHARLYAFLWMGAVVYLIWEAGGIQATQEALSATIWWYVGWVLFVLAMLNVRLRDLFSAADDLPTRGGGFGGGGED